MSKTRIIDMHNHVGQSMDGGGISPEEILGVMERAGIERFVVCPTDEQEHDPCYTRLNDWIAALARKHPQIIGFGRVAPTACGAALDEVRRFPDMGLRGLKLHVISDRFKIQEAEPVLRLCGELGLPVLCHSHHTSFTNNARHWRKMFGDTGATFIIAHGGKDSYPELGRIAPKFDNVYVDTTCATLWRTRKLFHTLGPKKLLFGSDMPYGHPEIELVKWRLVTGPEDLEWIFYKNAARLLGEDTD